MRGIAPNSRSHRGTSPLRGEVLTLAIPIWLARWTAAGPTRDEMMHYLSIYVRSRGLELARFITTSMPCETASVMRHESRSNSPRRKVRSFDRKARRTNLVLPRPGCQVGLSLTSVVFMILRDLLGTVLSFRAARRLHAGMLASVMRAPMSFFQATPQGRINNRFSKDMSQGAAADGSSR